MPQLFGSSGQTDVLAKQQLAQLLMSQLGQQNQGAIASGSPLLAAIAPFMQMLAAKKAQTGAQEAEQGLMGQRQSELARIMAAGQGTPAQPGQPFVDEQAQFMGQPSPEGLKATPDIPGKPGGREALIRAMTESTMPEFQNMGLQESLAAPSARWEKVPGPRGTVLQRNTVTGELKQVVGQTPSSVVINAGQGPKMSSIEQKELFEADETAQASENVIGMLDEALSINEKAYSGPAAKERAIGASWLPGDNEAADATINLDNIMTGQALESLKAVFGGMPTEGERKILLEMQASVGKTPKQRADIIARAKKAAENRIRFNKQKAESLRSGTYRKESPVSPASQSASPAQKGGLTPQEQAELEQLRRELNRGP